MGKENTASLLIFVERMDGKVAVTCRSASGDDEELNEVVKCMVNDLPPHVMRSIGAYYQNQQEKELNHVTH